jgi:hypothetical protein
MGASIFFEIFGRCPKIKLQKYTHARTEITQASRWLGTFGDDEKVQQEDRKAKEHTPKMEQEKQHTYNASLGSHGLSAV